MPIWIVTVDFHVDLDADALVDRQRDFPADSEVLLESPRGYAMLVAGEQMPDIETLHRRAGYDADIVVARLGPDWAARAERAERWLRRHERTSGPEPSSCLPKRRP